MTRPIQYFSDEYLSFCGQMSTSQICQYLESFRLLVAAPQAKPKRKLISLKVPIPLLECFRAKAEAIGIPYQTQIQRLMEDWAKLHAGQGES
jgi:predicted DNA binding CopG/RHH family protein